MWGSRFWLFYSRLLNGFLDDLAMFFHCSTLAVVSSHRKPTKGRVKRVQHVFRRNLAPTANGSKVDGDDDVLRRCDLFASAAHLRTHRRNTPVVPYRGSDGNKRTRVGGGAPLMFPKRNVVFYWPTPHRLVKFNVKR